MDNPNIYFNFQKALPNLPDAIAVEGNKVIATGQVPDLLALPGSEPIDLKQQWLAPAFIESHCHILGNGEMLASLSLEACRTVEDVLDTLQAGLKDRNSEWLIANFYDQNFYGRHLTAKDLDSVSTDVPIFLWHSNGHAAIANSRALTLAGISAATNDPSGGTFVRDGAGAPTGILLETAADIVQEAIPALTVADQTERILAALALMSSEGICLASDMATSRSELVAYEAAAAKTNVAICLYLNWRDVFRPGGMAIDDIHEFNRRNAANNLRISGIKLFSDGGISSRTAAIYGKYEVLPDGQAGPSGRRVTKRAGISTPEVDGQETDGQLIYSPEELRKRFHIADDAGLQVAIHAIGDYATDLVMDAFQSSAEPSRHRLEHAMILSNPQIERLQKLNCFVTMQPEFLQRLGHAYSVQLGPIRARALNRYRSILGAGIRLALDSDRPVVRGNPQVGMELAIHRPTQFDQSENLSSHEALTAYTQVGADVCGVGDQVGSLRVGQRFEAMTCAKENNPFSGANWSRL